MSSILKRNNRSRAYNIYSDDPGSNLKSHNLSTSFHKMQHMDDK